MRSSIFQFRISILNNQKALVLIEQLSSSGFNFLYPIVIGWLYGAEILAEYFIVFWAALIGQSIVRAMCLNPYLIYSAKHTCSKFHYRSSLLRIIFAFIIFSVVTFTIYYNNSRTGVFEDWNVACFLFLFIYLLVRDLIRGFCAVEGKYKVSLFLTLLQIFVGIGLFCGARIFNMPYSIVIFLQTIICILIAGYIFIAKIKVKGLTKEDLNQKFKEHFHFGKYSAANNVLQTTFMFFLLMMIGKYANQEKVAVFGAILSVSNVLSPLYQALNTYLAKSMVVFYSNNGLEALVNYTYRALKLSVLLGGGYIFIITLFGGWAFSFSYPNLQYVTSLEFLLIGLAMATQGIGYPISRMMNTLKKPQEIFYSGVIYFSVLVFYSFFLDYDAVVGALVMIMIGRIGALFYQLLQFKKLRKFAV